MTGCTNIAVGILDSQEPDRQVWCCTIECARVVRIVTTATFDKRLPGIARACRCIGSRVQDHVGALAYAVGCRFRVDPPGRVRVDRSLRRWSEVRVAERPSVDAVSIRSSWAATGVLDTDRVVVA